MLGGVEIVGGSWRSWGGETEKQKDNDSDGATPPQAPVMYPSSVLLVWKRAWVLGEGQNAPAIRRA
jgi:hypothetical protein